MTPFISVSTFNLTYVICHFVQTALIIFFLPRNWLSKPSYIDLNSWGRTFLSLLIWVVNILLALVLLIFFNFFAGLINKLKRPRVSCFKAFDFWIPYWGYLGRRFNIFGKLLATNNLLIYLLEYKKWQKFGLGFYFNGFCTKVFQLCNSKSLISIWILMERQKLL